MEHIRHARALSGLRLSMEIDGLFALLSLVAARSLVCGRNELTEKFMQWYDAIGSIGVGIIIVTYIGLQLEKIRSDTLMYSLLNAVGASLIIVSLIYSFNFSAFIVEFFWLLISLFGIGKYFLKRKI